MGVIKSNYKIDMKKNNSKLPIINYDAYINKPKYNNTNPLAPQYQFGCIISGRSGTGKTNVLLNLLINYLDYDELYIFLKDADEDKYQFLIEFCEELKKKRANTKDVNGKPNAFHYLISDDMDEIPDVNDLEDPSKQRIFVFDDLINEKNQKSIEDISIRGRKRNISWFYLAHKFYKIPPMIREQANYVLLFKTNKQQLITYQITFGDRTDKDDFYDMYKTATSDIHSFFMIDLKTNDPDLMFRKNFDGVGLMN